MPETPLFSRVYGAETKTVNIEQGEGTALIYNFSYKNIEGGNMNQEPLRERLNHVIDSGLVARAIAGKTGITTDVLSRFKNGYVCLCEDDALALESYLNKVVIP